ncbi:hypothetical protein BH20VER1_BH20VER1_28640 [soil metagenome]
MRRALLLPVVLLCAASTSAADNTMALHLQARDLLRRQQVAAALPLFERCVAAEPDNSKHRQWLGRALGLQTAQKGITAGLGGVNKVKAEFERAIKLDPNNLEARHDLAVFYKVAPGLFGGSNAKANEQVAIIRQRDPALATQIEADFLARDKKTKEAIALHQKSTSQNPARPRPHVSIAILHQKEKDWDNAFAALERALAIDSRYPIALYHIGRTAALSGQQLERGEKSLRTYIGLPIRPELEYPPLSGAHHQLGLILEKQGNADAARAEYQKALSIYPAHKDARTALAKLK